MCGIAGFVGYGGIAALREMNQALVHRGPDDEGIWGDEENAVFLGHRRLSIIDIMTGAQPMWTEDGHIGVVFNGEIYNHSDLRKQLSLLGHRFRTDHSDTEVLLHGYRQWGEELPNYLNGMWAFCIYDRIKRRLFCSRDRFGKKPFYYARPGGCFVFASELSSLIRHPAIKARVSSNGLKKYFAYGYIPAPNSVFEGIYKLPGGHSLFFELATGELRVLRYWDFVIEPFEAIPARAEEEWCEQLRNLISLAVKRRLMADVPLGFFLSGGIDSSSVVAFASRYLDHDQVNTFNIGFEEESFDESRYAMEVARLLATRHHSAILSTETALGLLPEVAGKLDEPMGDSSLLPTYLLCKHTRAHVKVALGGDGADELFAGYDPFRALRTAEAYRRLVPKPVHRAISIFLARWPVSYSNMSLDFKIKRTLRGLNYPPKLWCPTWMGPLDPSEISELFGEEVDLEDLYSEAIACWDECRQPNLVDKVMQFYTKLYLQDDILVKVDRASMMNSLEVRAPYLDLDLVDFVRHLPHNYKYRNGQTKYILKRALEGILPNEILYRAKKGFGVPIGQWFKKGVFDFKVDLLPQPMRDFTERRISSHRRGRTDERAFLWNSWILQAFLCQHPAYFPPH